MAERKGSSHFVSVLSTAIFEWLLLLLLFFEAFVQYLGSKFARSCKLQTPCLLCSRIDYILGNAKPGFVGDLICEAHRMETSSLAYCHAHSNLANVLEMCDTCLLSFAKEKRFNPAAYKSIVARACSILEDEDSTKQLLAKKELGPSCSCCAKSIRNHSRIKDLLDSRFLGTPEHADKCFSVTGSAQFDAMDQGSECSTARERTSEYGSDPEGSSKDSGGGGDDSNELFRAKNVVADTEIQNPAPPTVSDIRLPERILGRKLEADPRSPHGSPKSNKVSAEISNAKDEEAIKYLPSDKGLKAASFMRDALPPPMQSLRDRSATPMADIGMKGSLLSPKFANDFCLSPRVSHAHTEDSKQSDASSSSVLQDIAKRISSERSEPSGENTDGSFTGNFSERAFQHLKRQVELDRKSMSILYKELEEERSASAIAANQAMAMINRLQEEKAAMHMEALQYLRMMEEQTEYDQEALQRANEQLSQREKEIQDLEAELDGYRRRFGDEVFSDAAVDSSREGSARKGHRGPANESEDS